MPERRYRIKARGFHCGPEAEDYSYRDRAEKAEGGSP